MSWPKHAGPTFHDFPVADPESRDVSAVVDVVQHQRSRRLGVGRQRLPQRHPVHLRQVGQPAAWEKIH